MNLNLSRITILVSLNVALLLALTLTLFSTQPAYADAALLNGGMIVNHTNSVAKIFDANNSSDFNQAVRNEPPTGAIGNTIWIDSNGDGVQDPAESGMEGVVVELELPNNSIITTTTSSVGAYLFAELPYGAYTVTVDASTLPTGVTQSFDSDGELDNSSNTTLGDSGPTDFRQDFGYKPPSGSIGDMVWFDTNGDGIQDAGETGISGVVISLTLPSGTVITTTTSVSGTYLFNNLPPGAYTIAVDYATLAAPYNQTFDADGIATPHSSTIVLRANKTTLSQGFGYSLETTAVTIRNVASSGNTATRAALVLLIAAALSLIWLVYKRESSR